MVLGEEDVPNPMARLTPPKSGSKVVPVFKNDELTRLLKDCGRGKDFRSRRDAAIIRLFAATGMRLSELAGLDIDDVNPGNRTARVVGKGDKERIVKFDYKTAQTIDRYLRMRQRHKFAQLGALWLSATNRGALSANGIHQMIEARGRDLGIEVHPHKFRHHFSHRWLDEGGAEGDLMELNGWTSPQMLRRYGASARQARAGARTTASTSSATCDSGCAMLGEITNRERIGWQIRTTRVLGELLKLAHSKDLPPMAWTVGHAGATLVGRCLDVDGDRRAMFEAWAVAIKARRQPEHMDASGVTYLRAVLKDYDGLVDVAVVADVFPD